MSAFPTPMRYCEGSSATSPLCFPPYMCVCLVPSWRSWSPRQCQNSTVGKPRLEMSCERITKVVRVVARATTKCERAILRSGAPRRKRAACASCGWGAILIVGSVLAEWHLLEYAIWKTGTRQEGHSMPVAGPELAECSNIVFRPLRCEFLAPSSYAGGV
jgi:hypothetical protein